jgi:hypothetical protein
MAHTGTGNMNDIFIMHRGDNHSLQSILQNGLRPGDKGMVTGVYFRIPRVYNQREYDALHSDVDRIAYLYPDLLNYNVANAHTNKNINYFCKLDNASNLIVKNQNAKNQGSHTVREFLQYMESDPYFNTMEYEIIFERDPPDIVAYMQFHQKQKHIVQVSLTMLETDTTPQHTTNYDLYASYYITKRTISTQCKQCGKNTVPVDD